MDRLQRIYQSADLSIRRACGFAYLAIVTAMVGMASDAYLSIKTGAILSTLVCAVLVYKALRAPTLPYARTELWILLDKHHDLPKERAQAIIGGVLRERYFWHAERLAAGTAVAWLLVFALGMGR